MGACESNVTCSNVSCTNQNFPGEMDLSILKKGWESMERYYHFSKAENARKLHRR